MSRSWRRGSQALATWLVPVLGAVLVWVLVRTLVLNTFYAQGAYYLDAGWFANLAFRSDWLLTAPSGHPWAQASYFRHHLALFFIPLNALSYLADTDHVGFFAFWYGAIHVFGFGVGYTVCLSALRGSAVSRTAARLLAALAGFLFAFNGIAIAALLYPHPEVLMSFAIVGMLWALTHERRWLATAMGVLALSVRTDGGFHVAIFCGAAALGTWVDAKFDLRDVRVRRFLGIAVGGFLFSCLAYGVQAKFFPGGAQFSTIYAGPDFFGHVSVRMLTDRIGLHLSTRPYLFAGGIGCIAAFLVTRRWVFLAGALAALPWYLANLVARSDAAGSFFSYYGFPLIVLLAWPVMMVRPAAAYALRLSLIMLLAVALSVAGALGPGGQGRVIDLVTQRPVSSAQVAQLRATLDRLVSGVPAERVRFDGAVMSLVARQAARRTLLDPKHGMSGVQTVIHFERYMDTPAIEAAFLGRGGLWRCELSGTPLRLLSVSSQDVLLAEQAGLLCRMPR